MMVNRVTNVLNETKVPHVVFAPNLGQLAEARMAVQTQLKFFEQAIRLFRA